ncbi:MAG: sigma-54-dependent transcriptional regulator [Candidatus Poribacteria bacterium]
MSQILLIDDDYASINSIKDILVFDGHEVTCCTSVFEALKVIQNERHDLIITDMRLPIEPNSTIDDEGGLQIIKAIIARNILAPIIVITGFGSIKNSVDAMSFGAYDYLIKPVDFKELRMKVRQALHDRFPAFQQRIMKIIGYYDEVQNLKQCHCESLKQPYSIAGEFENLIGESKKIQQLKEEIRVVAGSAATVLIQGESGTGKELVARAIHQKSERQDKKFITLNCAAFPENLIEDELFGHRKGSFSSAMADRKGALEEANGGSLFLDEIGEMPLNMQPRLLRILEYKEVKRIGENIAKTVDVRVIAATNKKLEQEVSAGRFRADLFERLNVVRLNLPPLRQIKEDIPLLINHFIRLFHHDKNKPVPKISDAALDILIDYNWPGNVRELKNVIERTLLFIDGDVINEDNLRMNNFQINRDKPNGDVLSIPFGYSLEEIKLEAIRQTLDTYDGNKTHTARALGISTSTLWKALKTMESAKNN